MMFIKMQDQQKNWVVVFLLYTQSSRIFEENKILFVTGRTDVGDGSPKIIANRQKN